MIPHKITKMIVGLFLLECLQIDISLGQDHNSRWVHIANAKDGTAVYLEPAFKQLNNGNRIVWIEYVLPDGQNSLQLEEFACKAKASRLLELVNYNSQGQVTGSQTINAPEWRNLIPGSILEGVYEQLCSQKGSYHIEVYLEQRRKEKLNQSVEALPEAKPLGKSKAKFLNNGKDLGVDYAVVTSSKANLRATSDSTGNIVREAYKKDLLVLLSLESMEGWYQVLHVKSGEEGWIHSSTIAINLTQEPKPKIVIQGSRTGRYEDPYLSVYNNTEKVLTLKMGDTRYVFSPRESKILYLSSGIYKFYAACPGVIPNFGEQEFQAGYSYKWTFYIARR